ncbi:hypothetical protein E3N88_26089 [Mikania micrantha]|uniref:Uncharacterized protein n=1 Tax=Mikania micrantha TaxID=192012 RepID=A0A5N6N880_9ASTR|nr:hypothetical protein E3N88_26089 [Mikania micrantha]
MSHNDMEIKGKTLRISKAFRIGRLKEASKVNLLHSVEVETELRGLLFTPGYGLVVEQVAALGRFQGGWEKGARGLGGLLVETSLDNLPFDHEK